MANIGGYQSLIGYLAELENTTTQKVLTFKTKPKFKGEKFAILNGQRYNNPVKTLLKGGVEILKTQSGTTFPIDTLFDHWEVTVSKTLDDFKTEVKFVKKVKICEGGGWHSQGHQYKVNDRLFEF